MSETFVADVRKFAEAAGHTTGEFNVRQTALYIGLQLEEMAEKLESLLWIFDHKIHPLDAVTELMNEASYEFKKGNYDNELAKVNREEMLDADVDLAWVTIGSMLSQGVDVTGAMNEVVRSNMSKMVDGKMVKDANGKVIKGTDFSPPNLAPFIKND